MSVVATRHSFDTMHSEYYCLYCKNNDVVVDTTFGEAICRGCGLVVCERMVSLEAEWRDYDGDGEDTSHRARASVTNDFDDGTIFFSGGTKKERDFLTQVQRHNSTKKEQRIVDNMSDVSELTYKLGLGSQIKDIAKNLYRDAHLQGMARQGGSYAGGQGLVATCIYMACRQAGHPRTLKEIAQVSGVPTKHIARMSSRLMMVEGSEQTDSGGIVEGRGDEVEDKGEKKIVNNVEMTPEEADEENHISKRQKTSPVSDESGSGDIAAAATTDTVSPTTAAPPSMGAPTASTPAAPMPPSSSSLPRKQVSSRILPVDLVNRFCSQVALGAQLTDVARQACEKIHRLSMLPSASPQCVAAAVIVCVSHIAGKRVLLGAAASVASCSSQSINKTYSQLRPFIKTIFPKEFVISHAASVKSLPPTLLD